MPIEKKKFETEVGGKTLTLELSNLAPQTNASILAKYGETVVLVTVVMSKREATVDYLPLKVDYEEKFYAAGKIIGSRFIRREGRPSDEAILSGRLVDRTLRPLFDNRLRREVQVVVTILAFDEENDPDFVGLIGASTALAISDVPWAGPVGGIRVVKVGSKFLVNPNNSEIKTPDFVFETFTTGLTDKINMIELGGNEAGDEDILEAFKISQKEINKLIDFQNKVVKEVGAKKAQVVLSEPEPILRAKVEKFLSDKLEEVVYTKDKAKYYEGMANLKDELFGFLKEDYEKAGGFFEPKHVEFIFEEVVDKLVHKNAIEKDARPDGRGMDEVRELEGEVGLFERTHGSAVFMRGNTHALAITTLGPPGAEQLVETMEVSGKRRFMLHYNFPPYSVGEIGTFRGPGRREIGHGALAEKALKWLIPSKEEFPYTIRVVSEIVSSNGSSSMASVCAGSLSLMDAGVPIKKPAAGIAMGMMSDEKGNFKILTDIQGPEDHYGDMDFKVAGTEDGVTGVQLDVKFQGLSMEMVEQTLKQAKKARLHILSFMKSVLDSPRKSLSKYAPAIKQFQIDSSKIGMVIGPGGKMINGLIEKYALSGIDIDDDGWVFVSGTDQANVDRAVSEIQSLTKEFKVGEIIEGKVIKILDFGAIVDLGGGRDGMIHVSELKNGFVKNVEEVVKMGDFVRAKIIKAEEGKVGLSIKQLE